MSSAQVILWVAHGNMPREQFVFDEPKRCVIGRADDCDLRLAGDVSFANVSRHHCELDIDPPSIRVRDLGSRNGTWLNGKKIAQAAPYLENIENREPGEFVAVTDGDELCVGYSVFRVRIVAVEEAALGALAPLYLT